MVKVNLASLRRRDPKRVSTVETFTVAGISISLIGDASRIASLRAGILNYQSNVFFGNLISSLTANGFGSIAIILDYSGSTRGGGVVLPGVRRADGSVIVGPAGAAGGYALGLALANGDGTYSNTPDPFSGTLEDGEVNYDGVIMLDPQGIFGTFDFDTLNSRSESIAALITIHEFAHFIFSVGPSHSRTAEWNSSDYLADPVYNFQFEAAYELGFQLWVTHIVEVPSYVSGGTPLTGGTQTIFDPSILDTNDPRYISKEDYIKILAIQRELANLNSSDAGSTLEVEIGGETLVVAGGITNAILPPGAEPEIANLIIAPWARQDPAIDFRILGPSFGASLGSKPNQPIDSL